MMRLRKMVVAVSVAALSVAGIAPAAAAPGDPVGVLDGVTSFQGDVGAFEVAGWAAGTPGPPLSGRVHVYVDGVGAGVATTSLPRPDVAAYLQLPAGSDDLLGFSTVVTVPVGSHRVCAYAIGGSNPLLGCRTVSGGRVVPAGGSLAAARPALVPGTIDVSGQVTGSAVREVAVYLDDVTSTRYLIERNGDSYVGSVPVTPGVHRVCAYALGDLNPLLGCRSVDIPSSATAFVDSATLDMPFTGALVISVEGWAYDAAAPDQPGEIAVYVRTVFAPQTVFTGVTDITRTDVQAARGLPQAQVGFKAQVGVRSGGDAICDIWIYQVVRSGQNPLFYHYSAAGSVANADGRTASC